MEMLAGLLTKGHEVGHEVQVGLCTKSTSSSMARCLRAEWSGLLEWQISAEVAQQAAQVGSTGYNQPHVRLVIGTAGQACSARRLSGLAHGFLSDHELAARDISLVEACELLAATPACTRPAWRSTRATRSRCTTSHHLLLPLKCQHPFALSGRRARITREGISWTPLFHSQPELSVSPRASPSLPTGLQ